MIGKTVKVNNSYLLQLTLQKTLHNRHTNVVILPSIIDDESKNYETQTFWLSGITEEVA